MEGTRPAGVTFGLTNGVFEISCPSAVTVEDINDMEEVATVFFTRLRRLLAFHQMIVDVKVGDQMEKLPVEIDEVQAAKMRERQAKSTEALERQKEAVRLIASRGLMGVQLLAVSLGLAHSYVGRMVRNSPWLHFDEASKMVDVTAAGRREVLGESMEESLTGHNGKSKELQ
jgi:hypothetical protein